MPVKDQLTRPLRDLRLSVTDRCNFRCVYCMPKTVFGPDYAFLPHKDLLDFDEITRLAGLFVKAGVEKIRLTGGEPLVRRDVDVLVSMLAQLNGLQDLAMTTNGALLPKMAQALKRAGLARITVSLDALEDKTFMALNDVRFPVRKVLDGIQAAQEAGLTPIKVNMVVKRGVNEHQILPMAEHFRNSGHILRFIEFMDVGNTNGWRLKDMLPAKEILNLIHAQWPVEPLEANYPGEVASRYRYRDGAGEIGLIASVSQPFCSGCTRARLSAEGKLYTCLFSSSGHDLRKLLRGGASDQALLQHLQSLWHRRADRYSELRTSRTATLTKVEMSHIGG